MRKFLFCSISLLLLASCDSQHEHLKVTFEKAHGIVQGVPVLINDFQVGEVTKVSMNPDFKIDVQILLNDTMRLPNNSEFTIGAKDLFNKAIIVIPGKSKTYYKRTDKIIGSEPKPIEADSIIRRFEEELIRSMQKK